MPWVVAMTLTWILFGAWALGMAFISGKLNKEELSERSKWATARGTVISSKVSRRFADPEAISADNCDIKVQFSYEVGGMNYSAKQKWSTSYWPGNPYRPGDDVTVHYNPIRPEEAVVRPDELSGEGAGCLTWATGMVMLAVIIWIWSLT